MKTLIVVSGGDAPGINSVIQHYTALAHRHGDEVLGADGGFAGVLADAIHPIETRTVRLLAGKGGAYLPSSREPVLGAPDASSRLKAILDKYNIDNLLLFGGDGTLRHVLPLLYSWGIACIALPTTIDNDVSGTDYTLGHDSACNYAYQAVEGILATAHALTGRIFMVETLGGNTGYIALEVAYASGAQVVLVPEYDVTLEWLGDRLTQVIARDGFALVVLSEGVKFIPQLAEAIPRLTGVRLRYTSLGHAQRGGDVSHRDRQMAMEISRIAHAGFHNGENIGTIIVQNGQTSLYPGTLSGNPKSPPEWDRYAFINGL